MRSVTIILFLIYSLSGTAQNLPYSKLPDFPAQYTAGTVAARVVDGVGFRFYWATDGLRDEDLNYKPGGDAKTTRETIEHIYEMSFNILNATTNTVNIFGKDVENAGKRVPFSELRKKTLENLQKASDNLKKISDEGMKDLNVLFSDGKKNYKFPFWHIIGGSIEDCVWHAGQVVSFRRASGNPVRSDVDYFMGK